MSDPHTPAPALDEAPAYTPVALRPRRDGWTADRQRLFLRTLAETGCVTEACHEAAVSVRSAYRLRTRLHPSPSSSPQRRLG